MNVFHVSSVLFLIIHLPDYTIEDCILPEHPANGKYESYDSDCPSSKKDTPECRGVPGTTVQEDWLLFVSCQPGYKVDGGQGFDVPSVCTRGTFSPSLPSCVYTPEDCILPEYPAHGNYHVLDVECNTTTSIPGTLVPSGCVLLFTCNLDYRHADQEEQVISICTDNSWAPTVTSIACERNNVSPSPTPSTASSGSCTVPVPTGNNQFSQYNCIGQPDSCAKRPGDTVPHSEVVVITCDHGYYLLQGDSTVENSSLTTCRNGVWRPNVPHCYKVCQSLESPTVNFDCYFGQSRVDCKKPMIPGTEAFFSCKEYYERNTYELNMLKCETSGIWSRTLPYCTPKCGNSNLNNFSLQPAILGGNVSTPGNFPWQAGLYHNKTNGWEAVCGGTLISTRIVLTAAHCVTLPCNGCKAVPMELKDVMVGLGKIQRDWKTREEGEVKKAVADIRVHHDYFGASLKYEHDIALLVLESPVQLNIYVLPACVDYYGEYARQLTEDKTLEGFVAGWGNTEECSSSGNVCNSASTTLKHAKTTILNFDDCIRTSQQIKRFSNIALTVDKYCSGNGSESVVQQGDSGGGLTFIFRGRHYVYGVVSTKMKLEIDNRMFYSFGAFTNVTRYIGWLRTEVYYI